MAWHNSVVINFTFCCLKLCFKVCLVVWWLFILLSGLVVMVVLNWFSWLGVV